MKWFGSFLVVLLMLLPAFITLTGVIGSPSSFEDDNDSRGLCRGPEFVIDGVHVVTGTESYSEVRVTTTGRLEVPAGTVLQATSLFLEGDSELDVSGGAVELSSPDHSGMASLGGRCSRLNITDGGSVILHGGDGYADTQGSGPYYAYLSVSGGGRALVRVFVDGGILLDNATLTVVGGDGFDLPDSSSSACNAWQEGGTLTGYIAAGGRADMEITVTSTALSVIDNSLVEARGGRGGNASNAGSGSGSTPGKGGGYCNGGLVTGHVGTGGNATIVFSSSGALSMVTTDIFGLGGNGGNAGDGGDASGQRGGGGGGGFGGGDGSSYSEDADPGTVSGWIGTGGNATISLSAPSVTITTCALEATAGKGGDAGDGGDAFDNGGGGGGGYAGGGGTGRGAGQDDTPGNGYVSEHVGSGGSSNTSISGNEVGIFDTSIVTTGGNGGTGGDGGSGSNINSGGGGGGGYGGGGGAGDNCWGGDTWVDDSIGTGGNATTVLNGTRRLWLIDSSVKSNGGNGGNAGSGGPGPYGGGGGGGYGGAGGGGGGAYIGGDCTVTGNISAGGDSVITMEGIPCLSPSSSYVADAGDKGNGATSAGGGGAVGGEGKGFSTSSGGVRFTIPMCVPYLVTPTNGSTSIPSTFTYWAEDSTTHGDVTGYRIQIAKTSDFADPIANTTTSVGSFNIPLLGEGWYYWRVRAYYGTGPQLSVGWSDIYVFRYGDNMAPVLTRFLEDITMLEDTVDTSIDLSTVFFDEDDDPLIYSSAENDNITVTIASDGTVTLTPMKNWSGMEILALFCTDGFWHITPDPVVEVNVTVVNVNDPPAIVGTPPGVAWEDIYYYGQFEAYDSDPTGDTYFWYMSASVEWLTFDPDTAALSGTPDNDDVGFLTVTIRVNDYMDSSEIIFSLTILNTNDDPVIVTDDVTVCDEDQPYRVDYDATDIDPEPTQLRWSLVTNASFLSIDTSTGVLSGTPGNTDMGSFYVTVSVSDGHGGDDSRTFTLAITSVNDPPAVSPIGTIYVTEDASKEVDLTMFIRDIDGPPDGLVLECDHPNVVQVDGLTLTLLYYVWTGPHEIAFNVSDGIDTTTTFFIVEVRPVNDEPLILSIGDLDKPYTVILNEGSEETFEVVTFDEDGDKVRLSFSLNWDGVRVIGEDQLKISAEHDEVGTYTFTLIASDGKDGTHRVDITVEVVNINDPPEIPVILQPLNGDRFPEGDEITFEVKVADPDTKWGQMLTVIISSDRSGVLTTMSTAEMLEFTTDQLPTGHHLITVTVSDGELEYSTTVDIEVFEEHTVSGWDPWVLAVIIIVVAAAVSVAMLLLRRMREQE